MPHLFIQRIFRLGRNGNVFSFSDVLLSRMSVCSILKLLRNVRSLFGDDTERSLGERQTKEKRLLDVVVAQIEGVGSGRHLVGDLLRDPLQPLVGQREPAVLLLAQAVTADQRELAPHSHLSALHLNRSQFGLIEFSAFNERHRVDYLRNVVIQQTVAPDLSSQILDARYVVTVERKRINQQM